MAASAAREPSAALAAPDPADPHVLHSLSLSLRPRSAILPAAITSRHFIRLVGSSYPRKGFGSQTLTFNLRNNHCLALYPQNGLESREQRKAAKRQAY